MVKTENSIAIVDEVVMNKIYMIRNQKVMLDRDLAELYQVDTKQLKRQVKRNIERFPDDFMFEMNKEEFENGIKICTLCFHGTRSSHAFKCFK